MRLSASIMAHPDRMPLVVEMVQALDRDVPVYWDNEGPPSGNQDRVWRTARGAWQLHDPAADWHLLLQDDAVVCADLLAGLEQALEHVPEDAVVSPYLGRGGAAPHRWARLADEAQRAGSRWVVSEKLMWGVAICLPVARIQGMIERADMLAGVPDDMRVHAWARHWHVPIWYTQPSLVDHRAVASITKHKAKERRAERWFEGSALEIDWSGPVTVDPMYRMRFGPRSGPRGNWKVTSPQAARRTGKAGNSA